jgi:hypothetical protein
MTTSILIGLAMVVGSTAFAVAGMFFVRKNFDLEFLRAHHDVAAALLAVVGTLYAVLLAFVIVDAMSNNQQARLTAENEANALANIFRSAGAFPEPTKSQIRAYCVEYTNVVINEEWDDMAKGIPCKNAWNAVTSLWKATLSYEPVTETQKAMYQCMIDEFDELGNSRRIRLVMSRSSVSWVLWTVLIVGAISTIVFTYFFALESAMSQVIMTGLLTMTLALNLYLLLDYNNPYAGELSVRPDAFQLDMEIWEHLKHLRFQM